MGCEVSTWVVPKEGDAESREGNVVVRGDGVAEEVERGRNEVSTRSCFC